MRCENDSTEKDAIHFIRLNTIILDHLNIFRNSPWYFELGVGLSNVFRRLT